MGTSSERVGWQNIPLINLPTLGLFDATVKGVRAIALSPVS